MNSDRACTNDPDLKSCYPTVRRLMIFIALLLLVLLSVPGTPANGIALISSPFQSSNQAADPPTACHQRQRCPGRAFEEPHQRRNEQLCPGLCDKQSCSTEDLPLQSRGPLRHRAGFRSASTSLSGG
jgi:hypothetical protein